ncbi:hypothetical protein G5V59_19230 [Nocardioides sp. W3-2-3]|uniref:hypothetical protein n=1 Tax=Nocardioides convexus TaxID=2712224 RepID=UPI0024185EE5|nr:hypothetical protein [Nocardioides convexus]NHA01263.1 hypothetical protein [Nocardioides convexus]
MTDAVEQRLTLHATVREIPPDHPRRLHARPRRTDRRGRRPPPGARGRSSARS